MPGKAPPPPGKKPTTLAAQLVQGRRATGEQPVMKPDKLAEKSKVVAEQKATHRQQVWDKLDAAKKAADEKKKRLGNFAPEKAEKPAAGDDDFEL